MIRYPAPVKFGDTIGVTAPSSGVPEFLHSLIHQAVSQLETRGFLVKIGKTTWTQEKAASAPKELRAKELKEMWENPSIQAIIPPWGGEILQEILPLIDFTVLSPKWLLGYSDVSTLLFSVTVRAGIATAHGTNLVDLRSDEWDPTTSKFLDVLQMKVGESLIQHSSEKFQSSWDHTREAKPYVFHLTEKTQWKTIGDVPIRVEGRLLGGCLDTVCHLCGTPYGDIATFQQTFIKNEPILWYFEVDGFSATDFYRTLLQLQQAGWFQNTSGILFGRTPAAQDVEDFTAVDAMERLQQSLDIPIAYDGDFGHMPPQWTLVNGAFATVEVKDSKASLRMEFRP
ncbi:S66 family peptidase [Paenisporosarcina cavernae]|uniref:LD-carboxypeptidase n=1 Tax=Paenisporosarcina cavernae TaxID=2320858 RepID=A0A385YY78_9BACL|nr:S66 peptidase family protein [Paenisporosarcina cavernae]AYC30402.1 LD-carboxypeptidase [Paenisporosarcina cavernae]